MYSLQECTTSSETEIQQDKWELIPARGLAGNSFTTYFPFFDEKKEKRFRPSCEDPSIVSTTREGSRCVTSRVLLHLPSELGDRRKNRLRVSIASSLCRLQ